MIARSAPTLVVVGAFVFSGCSSVVAEVDGLSVAPRPDGPGFRLWGADSVAITPVDAEVASTSAWWSGPALDVALGTPCPPHVVATVERGADVVTVEVQLDPFCTPLGMSVR